ncbi:Ankyrin-3 [Tolypocladium ophioglossoides CBS 100239]|uniref:Ankyrin-3 n=1 Tax=Tolypocladium ophioglossoides (strain CBS 100239) TaxID=1163406 RepID=A0A0L0NCG2_TOLOC|nr:Ankyrin-3 [Tolypocladium ophioglossoides CBS 100239]
MAVQTTTELRGHNEYTVGWICALPKEQTAATAMLDHIHPDLPKPVNDNNAYTLGSISGHNTVIACLPKGKYGTNSAATVATRMINTFPSIKFGLMVGIGGGIPPRVRLGDVVVSTPVDHFPGVVQWDFGKTEAGGKFKRTGALNNPPSTLLTALTKLESVHDMKGSRIPEYLDDLKSNWPNLVPKYIRSASLKDQLLSTHGSRPSQITWRLRFWDAILALIGYFLGYWAFGPMNTRAEHTTTASTAVDSAQGKSRGPCIHYGLIASVLSAIDRKLEDVSNVVYGLRSRQHDQEHQAILHWLTPTDCAAQQSDFRERRQPGTGQWLLDANDRRVGISYVYCNFRRHDEQTAKGLLASLLKQLAHSQPTFPDSVKSLHDKHEDNQVFVIIDALDESRASDGSRTRFLAEVFKLQAKCGINIFATSRFIQEITEVFKDSISLEIRAPEEDVRSYLQEQMPRFPAFVHRNPELQEEIKVGIVHSVHGMFLLAQLHLESLVGKRRVKALRTAVAKLPTGSGAYDRAYDDSMSRIEAQGTDQEELAKQVLSWITSFPTFRSGYSELDEEPPERQHYPLFDYAAKCWVRHAQLGSPNPELLSGFLSSGSKMPSSCLLWAARKEEETCVHWLLERGVDANVCDATWKTPLHYAVIHSWPRCIQLLLKQGANITADIENMTPLHYTVSKTGEEMAQCLLDAGAPIDTGVKRQTWKQVHQEGKRRYTPENGSHESGMKVGGDKWLTALHFAALTGSWRMTKFLLDHGADPNAVSEYGETPLHLALKRDFAWIEGLLDIIDFDPEDEVKYCETKDMIEGDRKAVLTLLLDHELTDVNVEDVYGACPLHDVIYENSTSPEIIKQLIYRGANVSARNHQDQTPLHLACSKGIVDSVIAILEHSADITASDSEGLNALHYAAQGGEQEIIQHLLSHVASVDFVALMASRDNLGRNALHHLVSRSERVDCAVVQCLLDSGINVNDLDDVGMSPLATYLDEFLLLRDDAPRVARLLLQSGTDPSFKTRNGGLGLAHVYGKSSRVKVELLAVLADGGVDLQMEDDEGRTVLHQCAIDGSLTEEALHFLCNEGGLLKDSRDAHGKTLLQYAAEMRQRNHHPMIFDPSLVSNRENTSWFNLTCQRW